MLTSQQTYQLLVVEPNPRLLLPYQYLSNKTYPQTITHTIPQALTALTSQPFDLILLSTSFAPNLSLKFLESVKNTFTQQIVPLIFVVDLAQPLSVVPGTTWGQQVSVLHSLVSEQQVKLVLKELLH